MIKAHQSISSRSATAAITYGLVVCLVLMLPFHAQATEEEPTWRVTKSSGLIRYTSHGTTVYGHQFGFVKLAGQCDTDLLWLTWSSANPEFKQLIGTEVSFSINADGTKFGIAVDLWKAYLLTPHTTIAVFTNFVAGPDFIDLIGRSKNIEIAITGPQDVGDQFDVLSDQFMLTGFGAAREQAMKDCETAEAEPPSPWFLACMIYRCCCQRENRRHGRGLILIFM